MSVKAITQQKKLLAPFFFFLRAPTVLGFTPEIPIETKGIHFQDDRQH